jgi:hypothetical protein
MRNDNQIRIGKNRKREFSKNCEIQMKNREGAKRVYSSSVERCYKCICD